jgi:hypothetical protein
MRWACALGILAVAVLGCSGAASAGGYRAPRNVFGQPDFEGLWTFNSLTRLERPPAYRTLVITDAQVRASPPAELIAPDDVGQASSESYDAGLALARVNGEIRSSWIVDPVDGRLPFSEAGRARATWVPGFDGPEARSSQERCVVMPGAGPPMLNNIYNNNLQILQTREHLVIFLEHGHEARIVRIGEHRHRPAAMTRWMGDTIGWWDGDSFVMETTNFAPGQSMRRFPIATYYLSSKAVVTERLTRISPTQILYAYTVTDPENYTRPWRGEMPLTVTKGPMFEYACHEGNYSMRGILGGARRQEQEAVAAVK